MGSESELPIFNPSKCAPDPVSNNWKEGLHLLALAFMSSKLLASPPAIVSRFSRKPAHTQTDKGWKVRCRDGF